MYQQAKKNHNLANPILPKVLYIPRGAGKSTILMHESARTRFVMVVRSDQFKWHIEREAKYLQLDIPEPITFEQFINKDYNRRSIKGFLIDDVQDLLKLIAGPIPIVTIAVNNDNDFDERDPSINDEEECQAINELHDQARMIPCIFPAPYGTANEIDVSKLRDNPNHYNKKG